VRPLELGRARALDAIAALARRAIAADRDLDHVVALWFGGAA
jgi:hypothetical protein